MSEDNDAVNAFAAQLDAVDAALERLRAGTYRTCAGCGTTLRAELLAADPVRTHCDAHLSSR